MEQLQSRVQCTALLSQNRIPGWNKKKAMILISHYYLTPLCLNDIFCYVHKVRKECERDTVSKISLSYYFDEDIQGGLRDKPSKGRDFYHSCYNLSGLSVAQHCDNGEEMFGDPKQTRVARSHPCYNIRVERVKTVLQQQW